MKLEHLLKTLNAEIAHGGASEVTAVVEDSRRVTPGALFVAVRGEHSDGHDHAADAVGAGAVAVLGERAGLSALCGVPYIRVEHARRAAALLSHALRGNPSTSLTVIGVTGTNGKSSTVTLTRHVLEHCGRPAACFGTLGYAIGTVTYPARHTTPFGDELAEMFGRARDAGMRCAVMEVSSHALEQERVAGIDFDVAAFTNLTQDHLDFHKDMDAYRRAKLRLFERIEGAGRFTVVNADDPSAAAFRAASRVPCFTYGDTGDCRARDIHMAIARTRFRAETPWGTGEVDLGLVGRHNVANALCAIAICGGLELPVADVCGALSEAPVVPGRFEHVHAGQDFHVIVDYAHTDDGLRNVLNAAREICAGRVVVVFGCGGDRDRGKRPKMAAVAAELADYAVITSDNPRTEDPLAIIRDIEVGMTQAGKTAPDDYAIEPDRASAIRRGIRLAGPGDLVLIAGKGHEDYQILGTQRIHFDDREVARAILQENGGRG